MALSDSEASIVSPFTSLDKDISSVVEILREGRCCLASAFSSYKFMIMYGQLETILQLVAAWFSVGFAEWNWVWLDGILVVPLAFTLPLSSAATRLGPTRPTASLLGPYTMSSACGILVINVVCLIIALTVLQNQDCKFHPNMRCICFTLASISIPNMHVFSCSQGISAESGNLLISASFWLSGIIMSRMSLS